VLLWEKTMSLAILILIFGISLSLKKLAIIDLGECQCSRNIIAKTPESTLKRTNRYK
jgi:hypothetical protein